MSEKNKAILIVGIIIFVLSGAFLYQGYVSHSNIIDRTISAQKAALNNTIKDLEEFSFTPYRARIKNLINTSPAIVQAFAERDREQLYKLCLPKYEALKNENAFFHIMHFHLPDASTFLRIHNKNFLRDDSHTIRPIVGDVGANQKARSGFEIDKHGPLFRIVQPVFYENHYIGALEFGIKAHTFLYALEKKTNTVVTSYFLTESLPKAADLGQMKIIRYGQYGLLTHDNPIYTKLPPNFTLNTNDQKITIEGKTYVAHSPAIYRDFHDKAIGGILLLQDITLLLNQKKVFLLKGLFFSAVLLALAFVALYFTFGSIMGNLLREICERKKTEADLVESQQKLQMIFELSPAAIFIHDLDGKILSLNQTMLELYGVEKEEGLNLSIIEDYSSPANSLERLSFYWKEVTLGRPQSFEWIARRPHNNSTFPAQVTLRKIRYGNKDVIYATVLDMSARKEMEEKLASEKESLAVTLRSIGDGVITTDIEGRIVFINKVAEQLTGWNNADVSGKHSTEVFNIINERTGQKCASPVARVLALGRIVGLANHTALIAKDGNQISIADSGAPIRDRESKVVGVVIVFRDITHERKIEEELVKIRKLESIGVLAGGIAHDFNNILSAILGNIELASFRVKKDDRTVSLLTEAQKAAKRAAKLTQQLLTFSKGGDPVKEITSLTEIIRDSADFVLHGSPVSCDYIFPDDLWMVLADSGQVGQVIQNIILNAKHAMPEGGKIRLSCYNVEDGVAESLLNIHDECFVCIRIQDSGIGIPREITDKIFDPYFTTKNEGSGLGLAICHSIINKHDGHIIVQSTPGKGTTFTIYLPAVQSNGTELTKTRKTPPAMKAARIMVMDDDEMIRDVATAQLSILGHEVIPVSDGEQAINKYQELQDSKLPVDLVLMDLTIPGGMGGQEACQKLLQIDPTAKIIVASGYSNDPVMADFRKYGFSAAVAKPFDLHELRKAVESALGVA
ncbi:MAG: PAS domain S-box protein [Desulfocapsa sp.]|nr:PAS domain S-box protein [Desulfocapsa sp.]